MDAEAIARLFTGPDGRFRFARWAVPVVPMVYGVAAESLPVLKGGYRLVAGFCHLPMQEPAPAVEPNNLAIYVCDWGELRGVPDLAQVFPDIEPLSRRLEAAEAGQYRAFRFAAGGGIDHCLTLVRLERAGGEPADLAALRHAMGSSLTWAEGALDGGITEPGPQGPQIRADLLRLLRAAYDPVLPDTAADASFALRLAARAG